VVRRKASLSLARKSRRSLWLLRIIALHPSCATTFLQSSSLKYRSALKKKAFIEQQTSHAFCDVELRATAFKVIYNDQSETILLKATDKTTNLKRLILSD
jgi:hypothetical protein